MTTDKTPYYIPHETRWPIFGAIGMFLMFLGAINWIHNYAFGPYLFTLGFICIVILMFGWFGLVIRDNRSGKLDNAQMDRTFRQGMLWFIFSEVMFFGAFFGALFYIRLVALPWLSGESAHHAMTHQLLWPNFKHTWPLLSNPSSAIPGPKSVLYTWGIPAINTLILLASGVTITIAHWALIKQKTKLMIYSQIATIILGVIFLFMQVYEYIIAYADKGLTLASGIYGTTFFMLTGFHGLHVTIGVIMLITMLYRMFKNDFTKDNHFAFEAVSWYWHFVDVVWLALFVIVYWL